VSAALHLCNPDDMARLAPLVAAFHDETGLVSDDAHRQGAIAPLLSGSPLGAVYLIGPRKAPIGYIVITFGWSLEFGGMEGFIDEFYIRPGVRGRGVGSEVLSALLPTLGDVGLTALHLEVNADDARLQGFYGKHRFKSRDRFHLMTRKL
jgi:ribosomal protein S18 acetylase RimI-like enzyme